MANIGLTGRIACGKSTVSKIFAEHGFQVIDADKVSHELHNRPDIAAGIRHAFGDEVFEDGLVSRKRLGMRVFSDRESLRQLEAIMRPRILAEIHERLGRHGNNMVESFSIIDTEIEDWVDEVWVVDCLESQQRARLASRNPNFLQTDIAARIAAQLPRSDYILGADVVIDNCGDEARTRVFTEWELKRIMYDL